MQAMLQVMLQVMLQANDVKSLNMYKEARKFRLTFGLLLSFGFATNSLNKVHLAYGSDITLLKSSFPFGR